MRNIIGWRDGVWRMRGKKGNGGEEEERNDERKGKDEPASIMQWEGIEKNTRKNGREKKRGEVEKSVWEVAANDR